MAKTRTHTYPTRTEGNSPKAVGGAVGGGAGWAIAQLVLDIWPGAQSSGTESAVQLLCILLVGYVGAWLPRPGVIMVDEAARRKRQDKAQKKAGVK